jgi:hypothetical protein
MDADSEASGPDAETIESVEAGRGPQQLDSTGAGTVQLISNDTIVLIPTPSLDPKGKNTTTRAPYVLMTDS